MTREELEELEPLVRKYLDSTYSVWVEDWLNRHGGQHAVLLSLISQGRRALELEERMRALGPRWRAEMRSDLYDCAREARKECLADVEALLARM